MGINIDQIKSKLKELKSKSSTDLLWKPEFGEQTIRIVPYKERLDNPFIELFIHYNMGEKGFLSPMTFGKPDPIQEFSQELRDPNDKESYRQARLFQPRKRIYAPILVRGQESEGIKYWGFGATVYEQILSYIADDDYGDITDPMTGRDITLAYSKPETDVDYPKTSIRVKPNQTKAMEDVNALKNMIQEQVPLTNLFKTYTYDELKSKLASYLAGDSETEEESPQLGNEMTWGGESNSSSDSSTQTTTNESKSTSSSTTTKSEVESAFDDLFNS